MPFKISLSIKKYLEQALSAHDQPARGRGIAKCCFQPHTFAAVRPARLVSRTSQKHVTKPCRVLD